MSVNSMPDERKFKRRCLMCRCNYAKKHLFRLRQSNLGLCFQWQDAIWTGSSTQASSVFPVLQGRSAYLCTSPECVSKVPLQKGRQVAQALRTSISPETLESLVNALQHPSTST